MSNFSDLKIVMMYLLIALCISIALGAVLLPVLYRFKFGQPIREEGPKSHKKKAGTPTMGGVIFILATILAMAIRVRSINDTTLIVLFAFVAFGFIGLLDDMLKIIKKKNEGLKSGQKMLLLMIVSVIIGLYAANNEEIGTNILIPIVNKYFDLGLVGFVIFSIVYFAAVTNAVNLTDGLDGLASSTSSIVIAFFGAVALGLGQINLAVFCGILVGALLGFLKYNAHPAEVFMGDTGSLALGGAIGAIAMLLKLEIVVIVVGGIFVFETLSVIIQVISFKTTGKRVFKMAPVHHHFEAIGWHETKIVAVFSIVTVALCAIGFLII
ncbi:phospho-N-acetylmuramoyl-pentapeptide-transferase [Clostridium cellulovorans]|uniref:Phospho-N-acetylmuramoyl-pentapeptide-transferase n=1 Tax=Clostridium cellulovorans (strain ATCC 35296 / DSM 3052 / OCM 3 / 743B) TaxID=573061 RepID=D9SKK1_CLOC7|nr:phospho-N-acetylmuramoyl-pentapeptide-transferase [Clostridium cellulovorans]ADL51497.1 phospho-N-acetylmuramoyl-pentapeptide-transferase [Clostridium cellulovorans 743B]